MSKLTGSWRTMMHLFAMLALALGVGACALDSDDEAADEAIDGEEHIEEVRLPRPSNTGGIGSQPLPHAVGGARGFSRIHAGYSSVLEVWNAQFPGRPLPSTGYALVRGCADRLCAIHFVFEEGASRLPVDLLVSKTEMSRLGLRATTMPLDSGHYAVRTTNGTYRASDPSVGARVYQVDVHARPSADVLYKPGIASARANNYVLDSGLLSMMDANNGGSGAGYSATPIYNGLSVRTTGRTFSMRVDGNDIVYAEVYFNLANLAGPTDRIRTWVVWRWSEQGRWADPTLR